MCSTPSLAVLHGIRATEALHVRMPHELAISAKGTFNIQQAGGAVQLESRTGQGLVWVQLLDLPSAKYPGGSSALLTNRHAQQEVTGGTDCSLEVYCCRDMICNPFVIVSGFSPASVHQVSGRVADKIGHHMRG